MPEKEPPIKVYERPLPRGADVKKYKGTVKETREDLAGFPDYFNRLASNVNGKFVLSYDNSTAPQGYKAQVQKILGRASEAKNRTVDEGLTGNFRHDYQMKDGQRVLAENAAQSTVFAEVLKPDGSKGILETGRGPKRHELGHLLAHALAIQVLENDFDSKEDKFKNPDIKDRMLAGGLSVSAMRWFSDAVKQDLKTRRVASTNDPLRLNSPEEVFADAYRSLLGKKIKTADDIKFSENFSRLYPRSMAAITQLDKDLANISAQPANAKPEDFSKAIGQYLIQKERDYVKRHPEPPAATQSPPQPQQ